MTSRVFCDVRSAVAAMGAALAWATAAEAVVGSASVSVKDVSDQAVASATVKLVPKQPGRAEVTATTDANGSVRIDAEEGEYEVIVIFGGRERSVGDVSIEGGGTSVLDAVFDPVVKSAATTPLGVSVGPYYQGQFIDWSLGPEVERIVSGGTSTVVQNSSAGNDFRSHSHTGGVEVSLGTPSFDVFGLNVQPTLDVVAGGGSLSIDVDPAGFSLEGRGPLVGGGASLMVQRPRSPWFGLVDYSFTWMTLDMDREPCSPAASGLVSCASDSDVEVQTHSLGAQLGYSFGSVAVHGGVGYGGGRIQNDTRIERVFSTTSGTVVVQNFLDQQLESDRVEGILGVDFGCGPLFGRAETRFNGDDASVFLTLSTAIPGL